MPSQNVGSKVFSAKTEATILGSDQGSDSTDHRSGPMQSIYILLTELDYRLCLRSGNQIKLCC